jgi:hypothetical protein
VELTIEQKQALALAAARKRQAESAGAAAGGPPQGAQPGSREYADWALAQARAGKDVPQVSKVIESDAGSMTTPTDKVLAAYTSAVDSVPIIGRPLMTGLNMAKGALYDTPPDQIAAENQARQEANPVESVGGAIAGNVLPLIPLAATKFGQVAFGMTGGLPQRVLMGGATGGAIAAADQAIRSGGDVNKTLDAGMWGAGFGAAGGAIAPVVEDALFAAGRALGVIKPGQGVDSLSRPAREALIRTMQGNGALGPDGIAAIRAAGPRGMLVDASPAAADMLDTAFQRSGPGSVAAKNAVEARYTGAAQDTTQALDQALGAPMNPVAASEKIRMGTATARGNAYDAAYAQPIDYSAPEGMAIEALMKRVPQEAINAANKLMQLEGMQSAQIMAKIAPDGSIQFLRMPDVRQLDYITRGLNEVASSSAGTGALGGKTDVGRAYGNLAQAIRGQMKKAVPEYAKALQTAAHPIQLREAMQFGVDLLKPGALKVDIAGEIKAMTKPQLDMARQGARTYIDDVMAKLKAAMSDPSQDVREAQKALQMLLSRDARQKLGLLLGPGKANQLYAQLRTAAKSFNLKASTTTNSRTYGRLAVDQAIQQTIDGNAITALMRGEPLQAGKRTIQAVTGMDNAGVTNMKDKVFSEIANTLTMQGPQAEDMLTQLARRLGYPKPNAPLLAGFAQAASDSAPPVFDRP